MRSFRRLAGPRKTAQTEAGLCVYAVFLNTSNCEAFIGRTERAVREQLRVSCPLALDDRVFNALSWLTFKGETVRAWSLKHNADSSQPILRQMVDQWQASYFFTSFFVFLLSDLAARA